MPAIEKNANYLNSTDYLKSTTPYDRIAREPTKFIHADLVGRLPASGIAPLARADIYSLAEALLEMNSKSMPFCFLTQTDDKATGFNSERGTETQSGGSPEPQLRLMTDEDTTFLNGLSVISTEPPRLPRDLSPSAKVEEEVTVASPCQSKRQPQLPSPSPLNSPGQSNSSNLPPVTKSISPEPPVISTTAPATAKRGKKRKFNDQPDSSATPRALRRSHRSHGAEPGPPTSKAPAKLAGTNADIGGSDVTGPRKKKRVKGWKYQHWNGDLTDHEPSSDIEMAH